MSLLNIRNSLIRSSHGYRCDMVYPELSFLLSDPQQTFVPQAARSAPEKAVRWGGVQERTAGTSSVTRAAKQAQTQSDCSVLSLAWTCAPWPALKLYWPLHSVVFILCSENNECEAALIIWSYCPSPKPRKNISALQFFPLFARHSFLMCAGTIKGKYTYYCVSWEYYLNKGI